MPDNNGAPSRLLVVAGMPRGGTTYLYHVLQRHPDFFVPFRKELHYFFFNRDRGDSWYHDFFREMGEGQVALDSSPAYFMDRRCMDHLLEYRPDAKVILSVRDPADWSLSLYSQISTFTFGMPPYEEFIESYHHKIAYKEFDFFLTDDIVPKRVREYREAFGDNLLLYDFRLLREDLPAVMQAIERFAGVSSYFNEETIDDTVINASARSNFKPLTWLLSREWLTNAVGKVLPAALLRKVRGAIDAGTSKSAKQSGPQLHPPERREFAAEKFADQRARINELFSEHRIMLGSGTPLD